MDSEEDDNDSGDGQEGVIGDEIEQSEAGHSWTPYSNKRGIKSLDLDIICL